MFEIRASGIPAEKIVVGKPGGAQDMTNGGFMDPAALGTCVSQAVAGGWNAGVMVYQVSAGSPAAACTSTHDMLLEQYPRGNATWLSAVAQDSFSQ